MKITTTAERLKEVMSIKGWKQVDILAAAQPYCNKYGIKLGRNDISQYVSGKVTPSQKKLTLLGLALNVSETWLMGFDVPMEKGAPISEGTLSNLEKEYLELFRLIPPESQPLVLSMIKAALKSHNLL